MTTYKTIRLSQNTYEELLAYRAELEATNRQTISFDEAVEMALGEPIMLEHKLGDEKARFQQAQKLCTCGEVAKLTASQAGQTTE